MLAYLYHTSIQEAKAGHRRITKTLVTHWATQYIEATLSYRVRTCIKGRKEGEEEFYSFTQLSLFLWSCKSVETQSLMSILLSPPKSIDY